MSAPGEGTPGGVLPEPARLRLPRAAALFGQRASRLSELSRGHAASDWLTSLSALCAAQREAALAVPPALPDGSLPAAAPLCAAEWRRQPTWRNALSVILARVSKLGWPSPARAALERLAGASTGDLEALADAFLAGRFAREDLALAPFLAAGLQAYFTGLAERIDPGRLETSGRGCPVCASPPVAGAIQGDDRVRLLRCSLCGSDWHLVRVQCATCRSGAGLSYAAVEGAPKGTRAEVCSGCKTYLKLFTLEDQPGAEPLADDAASLSLDLLLAEEGYARGGVNLLLAPPLEGVAGSA